MSKVFNTQTFDIYSTEKDVVSLRDFANDKDTLAYKRLAPKRTKDSPGMAKSELKITRVDPTTGVLIGIVNVSSSIRADATAADKTALMAIITAAQADGAWTELVTDQRLPLATV